MLHRILAVAVLLGATSALMGQSSLSFEIGTNNATGAGGPTAVGDFNGDGKPDMAWVSDVVGSTNVEPVYVQLGNGDGTFQAPVQVGSIPNGAQSFIAADLNNDGILDLIAVEINSNPRLYVWFGNGDGTFQAPRTYSTTFLPYSVAAGNFFGDGRLDLAVSEEQGNIDFFKNEGGDNFVFDQSINVGGTGADSNASDVVAADLNGNGIDEPAVLTQDAVWVLWNDGKGNFTPAQLASYVAPSYLSVARLNGDAMDDLIVSYTCNPTPTGTQAGHEPPYDPCQGIDVFYGQGGNKTYQSTVVTDPGVYPGFIEGVDVNGDGIGDLVTDTGTVYGVDGVYAWEGKPDGSFEQTPQVFMTNTPLGLPVDLNRDGMIDFVDSAGPILNASPRAACGTYTISPSVTVCEPVDNTYSNSPVEVEADSFDTSKVTAMQEYLDGTLKYSEPVTSFNTTFATSLGTHQFVTKGWDASGRSFVADRTVTVYSGTPGSVCAATTPNTAAICIPSGASSSSPVHIVANGYTTAIVTGAQLYIDGSLAVNNSGMSYVDTSQSLAGGTHDLVFKVWDANGDVYTASKTITVN